MKTHLLTISLFIFLVNGSLGQTALSVAVSLNARTTKYEYSSPLNTQSLQIHHSQVEIRQWPASELSLTKFSGKNSYRQWGIYGWHVHLSDDIEILEERISGLEFPASGTRRWQAGGGIHHRRGWLIAGQEAPWQWFLCVRAGVFYQFLENIPKTSQVFPATIHSVELETGGGLSVLRRLGGAGFVSLGMMPVLYRANLSVTQLQNPLLNIRQQRETAVRHSGRFWERTWLEVGGSFFLKK